MMSQARGRIHHSGRGIRVVVCGQGGWVDHWKSMTDPCPPWMERVEHVGVAAELAPTIQRVRPHLVVLECGGADDLMRSALPVVREKFPLVRILAVVTSSQSAAAVVMREHEFAGFVSVQSEPAVYLGALSSLAQGRRYADAGVVDWATATIQTSQDCEAGRDAVRLTPQEARLLPLLADGLGNREISERLRLSEHTVRNYLSRLYGKVGCSTRTSAVSWYLRSGRLAPSSVVQSR